MNFVNVIAQLNYITKRGSRLARICNETKAQDVGNHDGNMSGAMAVSQCTIERDLSALQKLGVLMHEGKDNNSKWVIKDLTLFENDNHH